MPYKEPFDYAYAKYRMEPKDIPNVPHYVALVFWDHHYSEPGWDANDHPSSTKVKTVAYYAFPDKKTWEEMISAYHLEMREKSAFSHAYDKKEEIVFYHCSGRGKITMKIDITIHEPEEKCGYDYLEGNRG